MEEENKKDKIWLHITLFVVTVATTTFTGAYWRYGKSIWQEGGYTWEDFSTGFAFSFPLLLALTVHEFGHYFTARYYKVKASLPYFIPFWFLDILPTMGTMGAVIRIRQMIQSRKQHFDIGIAGPLAGFVIALGVLYYGFTNLPPQEYIYEIHPEYLEMGSDWEEEAFNQPGQFYLGTNLLFLMFEEWVVDQPERLPNAFEMYHYPWLFAGFLVLFFTALNLLPIGQLDGGHILYGLVGYRKHKLIATVIFMLMIYWGGLGFMEERDSDSLMWSLPLSALATFFLMGRLQMALNTKLVIVLTVVLAQLLTIYFFPEIRGYSGYLLFALIFGRFLGVYHPPAIFDEPLSTGRKVLGWLALLIFILCFSPEPFVFILE